MKSTAIGWWIWHLIYGLPWRYFHARKLGGSRRRSWRVAWGGHQGGAVASPEGVVMVWLTGRHYEAST